MIVLLLSPDPDELVPILDLAGDVAVSHRDELTQEWLDDIAVEFPENSGIEFIVSYKYRHILKQPVLSLFDGRMINIHFSFLPWNRGADPNYWSIRNNTPKGVTIHQLDAGIDTGPILCQREVTLDGTDTLATSYAKLEREAIGLFADCWPAIRLGKITPVPQPAGGSYHRSGEMPALGYDTPVKEI